MRQSAKDKPPRSKRNTAWLLNRKQFIGSVLFGGIATQFPVTKVLPQSISSSNLLTEDQIKILQSVQEILFPSDGNGPSAIDIKATQYLLWVLSDPNKDPEGVQYIIDGIGWVDETAEEQQSIKYNALNQAEKEDLIKLISKENWGESWLSVILSFIFEALLSDPLYGGNTNSIGWNWLEHNQGQPRPGQELLYPKILNTIRKS